LAPVVISHYGWMAAPDGQARLLGAGIALRAAARRRAERIYL